MKCRADHDRKREQGMALLIAAFVLMLIGAIAVAAITQSGEESTAAGRTRSTTRSLHAADAGIQLALNRIAQTPPNLVGFSVSVGGRTVESRTRSDATPQPISLTGTAPPPEGYSINVGSGYINEIYVANVTSTAPDGATSELEAKLTRLASGGGGY